jgi:hypothetical protein
MAVEEKAHLLAGARATLWDLGQTGLTENQQLKLTIAIRLIDDVLREAQFEGLDGSPLNYNAW